MGNITKELQKLLKDYNKKVLQSVPTMARQIATDAEPEYRKIINESGAQSPIIFSNFETVSQYT